MRDRNEDAILIDPGGELWAVADGMGGHGQGDVAASMVIDALALSGPPVDPEVLLVDQLQASNAAIHTLAAGQTMGATVVAVFVDACVAYCAWVGDSRIYLWRKDCLTRLSRDHSRVQELIDEGALTEQAARTHPERNVITRAIGAAAEVDIDIAVLPLLPGDRVILCSDGLTGVVDDAGIAEVLRMNRPDNATAARLLQRALDGGAPDNVSVVVISTREV